MDRVSRVAATKLPEWTQSDFEVLEAPGFSEDFHSNIAGSEVRNVQIYYPPRILLSSCDRVDERIVFPRKINGCLSSLFNSQYPCQSLRSTLVSVASLASKHYRSDLLRNTPYIE